MIRLYGHTEPAALSVTIDGQGHSLRALVDVTGKLWINALDVTLLYDIDASDIIHKTVRYGVDPYISYADLLEYRGKQ